MSDDAHKVEQVGLNYRVSLEYLKRLGVERVYYLEKLAGGEVGVDMLDACKVSSMTLEEVERVRVFWGNLP